MNMRTIFASILFVAVAACGDDAPSTAPNGAACEVAEDCTSFAIDEETGGCWQELVHYDFFSGETIYTLDDGMCSASCTFDPKGTTEEKAQGSCGDTEYCLVYGSSESICFQACDAELPCREDYECTEISHTLSTCLPPDDAARVVNGDMLITTAAPNIAF
jgi:hypothetical protein